MDLTMVGLMLNFREKTWTHYPFYFSVVEVLFLAVCPRMVRAVEADTKLCHLDFLGLWGLCQFYVWLVLMLSAFYWEGNTYLIFGVDVQAQSASTNLKIDTIWDSSDAVSYKGKPIISSRQTLSKGLSFVVLSSEGWMGQSGRGSSLNSLPTTIQRLSVQLLA